MKRKLLSFAIAFALLAQTVVSAGALYDSLVSYLGPGLVAVLSSDTVTETITSGVKSAGSASDYESSVTASSFDYQASIDMLEVRKAFIERYNGALLIKTDAPLTASEWSQFENSRVTGNFAITLTYSYSGTTPYVSKNDGTPLTKSDIVLPTGSIFEVDSVDPSVIGTVVINIKVKDATPVTIKDLYDSFTDTTSTAPKSTKLDKITVSLNNLRISHDSEITISLTGQTDFEEIDALESTGYKKYAKLSYASPDTYVTTPPTPPSTVNVYLPTTSGGGGGRGISKPVTPVVPVITDNDQNLDAEVKENTDGTYTITIKSKPEEKDGFIENGWSQTPYAGGDKNYDGVTVIENAIPDENGNFVFHPRYVNVTVPSALEPETDENGNFLHKVYIHGYPDGEVKPNGNITREEVTAAFDRLLNVAFRANIVTTEQNFPDVNGDRWSNESIATMANGGFIVGDESGNFNPSKPITRAEFAVIASKFAPIDAEPAENYFSDIDGHWAKDFILKIAGQYWISGNPDGTFNPDAYITRAEAMTIINRMLVRYGDHESDYATQWPDVEKNDWYYDSVIEATTHNTYVRTENGWSEAWIGDEEVE